MKICSRDGCTAKVQARGLCNNHYTQWHRKLAAPLPKSDTRELLLAAMPGTTKQLAERVGVLYETARKAIRGMHAEGLIHIEDHLPPENQGRAYLPVFAGCPGVDHQVTPKQRKQDHLAARRAWYRRNASKPRTGNQMDPLSKIMHALVS